MPDELLRVFVIVVVLALLYFSTPKRKRASPGHRRSPTTSDGRSDTRDRYLDIERRLKSTRAQTDKDESPKNK